MLSLIFYGGLNTSSCAAEDALRIREWMSAIGSVIDMGAPPTSLPLLFPGSRRCEPCAESTVGTVRNACKPRADGHSERSASTVAP